MECTSCGSVIEHRARFCGQCGALTSSGLPFGEKIGRWAALGLDEFGAASSKVDRFVWAENNRRIIMPLVCATLLAALGLLGYGLSAYKSVEADDAIPLPPLTADGLPDLANYEDFFLSEQAEFLVTGTANVRDFPTSQGTSVIQTFAGGELVLAREVQAYDQEAHWFKLASGGYIWGGNLTEIDAPTHGDAPTFPVSIQGLWSTRDRCRGADLDYEITITADEVSFYESTGHLMQMVDHEGFRTGYHLAMQGEGNRWQAIYDITIMADGEAITVHNRETEMRNATVFHRPEASCADVLSTD